MHKPQVSILIPFKNTADFLPECLHSILEQTYQNWEVIAINDHSIDDSDEIAKGFSQKDQRIRVYTNSGEGIIEALRFAYAKSSGKLITRMDSDDIMTPNKLEVLVKALENLGRGHLAVGQVKYFSKRGISDGYARYEKWLNSLTSHGTNYSEIYKECVIPSPCWMIFREDFDLCGAFEPDRYPEDYDLAFRFRGQGLKCISCDQVIHHWRDYDTRTSRTSEHYAQNYFLDIKLHYFLKQDYNKKRPLAVWGAGTKGKTVAQSLLNAQIDFTWLCDNPNKIGKSIYGIEMRAFDFLESMENPQSIVSVANETQQKIIRRYFKSIDKLEMEDYFFFC
jgi:glycosyltransferase involved in cell wall biosynthesis